MQETWNRIEQRLWRLGCLEAMQLRPGAAAAELAALEQHVGLTLPPALKLFLQIHDGQDGFGLIHGQQLLSVAGIATAWDNWRALDEEEMNADCAEFMRSEPEGFIKPEYCNCAWLPLTHDAGGNHIGLDFDPGPLGSSGQVIVFGRDEDTKCLLAASFEAFVESCAVWLERAAWNGKYLAPADDAG